MPTSALLKATAAIISDYRIDEIPAPDAAHVEKWLSQFDKAVQDDLLNEMHHVLGRTYVPKSKVERFLSSLVTNDKLTGGNPRTFWNATKFLDVQTRGRSQREFLALFAKPLKEITGLELAQCGKSPSQYVYIDDGIFTGTTIINGLSKWLETTAPNETVVHVIVIVGHSGGQYYAKQSLIKAMEKTGKKMQLYWWAMHILEDRKYYIYESDVLRPTVIPKDGPTETYAASLKYEPTLRRPGSTGRLGIFSTENGRHLLEQQLLMKGCKIRIDSPRLPTYARPLGDMVLQTLGFGSTFVTYRNCPNNAPLAFWAGNPWYPLFPRKTN